jgi:hypothetical protein
MGYLNADIQKELTAAGLLAPVPAKDQMSEAEAEKAVNMSRATLRFVPFGKKLEKTAVRMRITDDLRMIDSLTPKLPPATAATVEPKRLRLHEMAAAYMAGC